MGGARGEVRAGRGPEPVQIDPGPGTAAGPAGKLHPPDTRAVRRHPGVVHDSSSAHSSTIGETIHRCRGISRGIGEDTHMLELAILGFLYEQPLHGYELKRRVAHLTGHVRPIADGTL